MDGAFCSEKLEYLHVPHITMQIAVPCKLHNETAKVVTDIIKHEP